VRRSLKPTAVIFIIGLVIINSVSAAAPVPSPELQRVLKDQEARVASGSKDVSKLMSDLRGEPVSTDPVAKFLLAMMIGERSGEARDLLSSSANAGCAGAEALLGMQLRAEGKDTGNALILKAAQHGETLAQVVVSQLFSQGVPPLFPKSQTDALAWAYIARSQSHTVAASRFSSTNVGKLESGASAAQLEQAQTRFAALAEQFPRAPFYLCGQSIP